MMVSKMPPTALPRNIPTKSPKIRDDKTLRCNFLIALSKEINKKHKKELTSTPDKRFNGAEPSKNGLLKRKDSMINRDTIADVMIRVSVIVRFILIPLLW